MSRGELRAERYAQALLARCEAAHALNAFITLEPERVLEDARARDRERQAGARPGMLFGLRIPVKDSVNTRDYPTTGGTPALRHFRPQQDAPVVSCAEGSRCASCSAKPTCTSSPTAGPATTSRTARSTIPTTRRAFPAAAAAALRRRSRRASRPSGWPKIPKARFAYPPRFAASWDSGRPPDATRLKGACRSRRCSTRSVRTRAPSADLALFDAAVAPDSRPLDAVPLRGVRLGIVRDYWFEDLDAEVERITDRALARLRDAGAQLIETGLPGVATADRSVDLPGAKSRCSSGPRALS